MKKYLVFTIILFLFGKVYAEDIIYSEWSSEYPTNVSKLIIKKEYRYLWYKEEISDIKYLREEEATDRIIDYNDMILKRVKILLLDLNLILVGNYIWVISIIDLKVLILIL